jgi:hypothetical protein
MEGGKGVRGRREKVISAAADRTEIAAVNLPWNGEPRHDRRCLMERNGGGAQRYLGGGGSLV